MIKLGWITKFRELLDSEKDDREILIEFEQYCNKEEARINREWRKQNENKHTS